jgi:hypothetical protein
MTDELKAQVAALRAIAPRLNAASDEAFAVVRAVEEFLGSELSLGISAESSIFAQAPSQGDDEGDPEMRLFSCLAYGRVGGVYQLHILEALSKKTVNTWGMEEWDPISRSQIPWSSCTREVKLESFEKLPELLRLIAHKAETLVEKTAATSATVRELLDAMKPENASTEAPTARPRQRRGE